MDSGTPPSALYQILQFSVFITFQRGRLELTQEMIMQKKLIVVALAAAIALPLTTYAETSALEEIVVTATRFKDIATDKPLNVSVLTQNDIQQSSARTLPELLSAQAGISMRDFFGNNAASSTVDMRGFGAAAGQNTLILLDGRRISDPDLAGVQWAAIPFSAIERIEIIRGSGAVLFGDGATNGVINIITRVPTRLGGNAQISARAGSHSTTEVQVGGGYFSGEAGIDMTASKLNSQGFRANNKNEQTNAQANLRWLTETGELLFKLGLDQQNIRLPGARTVQPSIGLNQVATDARGTATPLDFSSRYSNQLALEWEQHLGNMDLNVGVANRSKNQKSYFDFLGFPNYRDGDLSVTSFTPRIRIGHQLGGESSLVAGIDLHRWQYALSISNAAANIGRPINRINMSQHNDAWYLQNTTHLSSTTTLLAGMRSERVAMNGNDLFNAAAPGAFFGSGAPTGSFSATKNAYEVGVRQQLNSSVSLNGKMGRSFRFANVDEIYESGPAFTNQFQFLRPQTADGVELSVYQKVSNTSWRATVFRSKVIDEIHLDPFSLGIGNTNLPPSRRQGLELEGKWQALPQLALNGNYTYTDARFLSGTLNGSIAGKMVPLVANQKIYMSASWAISGQTKFNTALTYVGSQFMENDESNTFGTKIPAYSLLDLKLIHEINKWQLSASVNNLFDRQYFNYAVSSAFTPGRYNAYTLPGRSVFLGLSYQQ